MGDIDLKALREETKIALRAEKIGHWSGYVPVGASDMIALLDRLEAAEKERDELRAAQAVSDGEVLVTVTGLTGSGKSAICGEIEILCKALGLSVDWKGGLAEKCMTHADWTGALDTYKPRVRIIEANVPRAMAQEGGK